MLKIYGKGEKIAPEEQFLPLSTIFYYLMLYFYVKTGIRFSLRDKRLFEITEVEITRVNCIYIVKPFKLHVYFQIKCRLNEHDEIEYKYCFQTSYCTQN